MCIVCHSTSWATRKLLKTLRKTGKTSAPISKVCNKIAPIVNKSVKAVKSRELVCLRCQACPYLLSLSWDKYDINKGQKRFVSFGGRQNSYRSICIALK